MNATVKTIETDEDDSALDDRDLAAAFLRDGIWYIWDAMGMHSIYSEEELDSNCQAHETSSAKSAKLAGRAIKTLRGNVPLKDLAASCQCSVEELKLLEKGEGLERLSLLDAFTALYGETYPPHVLQLETGSLGDWRKHWSAVFREGRGDRDLAEIVALTEVSAKTIKSLEAGRELDGIYLASRVLRSLEHDFQVQPPHDFDVRSPGVNSLADFVCEEIYL